MFFSIFSPLQPIWKQQGNEIRYSFSFDDERNVAFSRNHLYFGKAPGLEPVSDFQFVEEVSHKYQDVNIGTHFSSWFYENQANQKIAESLGRNLESVIDAYISLKETRIDIQDDDTEYSIFKFQGVEGLIIIGKTKVDRLGKGDHQINFIRSVGYNHILRIAEKIGLECLVDEAPENVQLDFLLEQVI